jgi:hypothetical protein
MGSLSSPAQPIAPNVFYIPTGPSPTATAPAAPAASSSTQAEQAATEQAAEQAAAEARTDNLLRRGRGRMGTIHTSFRGLLAAATPPDQRKTLLGE